MHNSFIFLAQNCTKRRKGKKNSNERRGEGREDRGVRGEGGGERNFSSKGSAMKRIEWKWKSSYFTERRSIGRFLKVFHLLYCKFSFNGRKL